jgi:hypothetical protein
MHQETLQTDQERASQESKNKEEGKNNINVIATLVGKSIVPVLESTITGV